MSPYPPTLYLIRHAAVKHTGCYTGHSDVECVLPATLDMTHAVILKNPSLPWHCSDLKRARDSARWLADTLGLSPTLSEHRALREQDFGAWEQQAYDTIYQSHPELDWDNPAMLQPPGGESFTDVCARLRQWLSREITSSAVIVAHAGSIRGIIAHYLQLPPSEALQLPIAPGSISAITSGGKNALWLNQPLFTGPATSGQ